MANTITFTTRDKTTRAYSYEFVTISLFDSDYEMVHAVRGTYSWVNRSWQKYDYQQALLNALNLLHVSEASKKIVHDATSYTDALAKLYANLEISDNCGNYVPYALAII